jgi:FAD/FMN-containing dehydrogenase
MRRRDFLKAAGGLVLGGSAHSSTLEGSTSRVHELTELFDEADGRVFTRENWDEYARLMQFYNKRFACINPDILIYCKSSQGVAKAVLWCQANRLEFSIRSGGHSYEGLSRSNHVIIDVRGLNAILFNPSERTLSVGSGTNLGSIYKAITAAQQTIPAGTCPTIGIAGHALAGGLGFFVRQFGLALDSLRSVELVNAAGSMMVASHDLNADLFWAVCGAGPGSFGVVTNLSFETYQASRVHIYEQRAVLTKERAARFMAGWQSWISEASARYSSAVFAKKRRSNGEILLEVKGLVVGPAPAVHKALELGLRNLGTRGRRVTATSLAQAVEWFSAGENFPPTYEKGKSDFVNKPLPATDWHFLFDELTPNIDAEFHALGGRMAEIGRSDTAFPHRGDALAIQWGIAWERPEQEPERLREINAFYNRLRPMMSSGALLNYADCDIADPGNAYWGINFPRLAEIKKKYDPGNVFRHALSVPLEPRSDGVSKRQSCA